MTQKKKIQAVAMHLMVPSCGPAPRQYFGGTGITLEWLKHHMPTAYVDGTAYPIEKWLEECAVFDALKPGESRVFIPYGGALEYGTVTEVVWAKHEFKHYDVPVEIRDWWFMEPYVKVKPDDREGEYYVYEISFYKKWKRKTQMKHLAIQQAKPKRRFLSAEDIAEHKKQEAITNSQNKRK